MAKAKEKPGMMMYWEMFETLERVKNPEKLKTLLKAMRNLSQYGEIPDFNDDETLDLVWPLLSQRIMKDSENYEGKRKDNQIKGWKSDFKRNYAPANGIDPNDEAALEAYIQQRLTMVDNSEQQPTKLTNNSNNYSNSNNDNDNDNNNDSESNNNSNTRRSTPALAYYGQYKNVRMTIADHDSIMAEFPNGAETLERLSDYIRTHGKNYPDHAFIIRKWAREDANKPTERKRRTSGNPCDTVKLSEYDPNDSPFDDTDLDGVF